MSDDELVIMQNAWTDVIIKLSEEGLEISENLLGAGMAALSGVNSEVERFAKLEARRKVNSALGDFAFASIQPYLKASTRGGK